MENKNIKSFVEFNENSNSKTSSSITDVSDSDLINQIKKYKDELLIDLEEMTYTSEQPIPDSFFNLSRLIDKLDLKHIRKFNESDENSNSKTSSSITENWRDDLTRKITKQDIIDIISNLSVEEAADEIMEIMDIMTSHR